MIIGYINTASIFEPLEQKKAIQQKARELNISIDDFYTEHTHYYNSISPFKSSKYMRGNLFYSANAGDTIIIYSIFNIAYSSHGILRTLNYIIKKQITVIAALENLKVNHLTPASYVLDILEDIAYHKYNKDKQKIFRYSDQNLRHHTFKKEEQLQEIKPQIKEMLIKGVPLYRLMKHFKIGYYTLTKKIFGSDPDFLKEWELRKKQTTGITAPRRPLLQSSVLSYNRKKTRETLKNNAMLTEDK